MPVARVNGFVRAVVLSGPASALLFRPWYDSIANAVLGRWYFPLSRAWAAALAAGEDVAAFAREVGDDAPRAAGQIGAGQIGAGQIAMALAHVRTQDARYRRAAAAWEDGFFAGPEGADFPGGAALEAARARAAFALMRTRASFLLPHFRHRFPAVRFDVAAESAVAARHGGRLADPAAAFPAPDSQAHGLVASRSFVAGGVRHYWLRGESTVGGVPDMLWARVREPVTTGSTAPGRWPTVVLAHGLAIEEEFWGEQGGSGAALLARGLRVVQPEGPWHGRRRLPGRYGGEPVSAYGVAGMLDYFAAHVPELARLVAWARAKDGMPVALAGISLGALTAQMAATAARGWPAEMRPDALFLVAVSGSIRAVAYDGALADVLGARAALLEGGWTPGRVAVWLPLLEPQGAPDLPPDRILMVLGEADRVTPFAEGMALARRWGVPARNLWVRRQGHFTLFLGLPAAPAPLDRLAALLRETAADGCLASQSR